MTPGKLRTTFLADETLWVDGTDQLFYVEPTTAPGVEATPTVEPAAPFPLEQTFLLHSRPGSQRVIYLDFDGETVTGTAWNNSATYATGTTIDAEPYDTDGVAGFSDTEKEAIQDTWRRVAEDYAPFDVDITTQDPGYAAITRTDGADTTFGTRVVFDGGTPDLTCSCGGLAYIDVFDLTGSNHDYYQPAWVFQGGLGGLSAPAKNLAEAASHEVGHNLGLHHDGRTSPAEGYYYGHDAWAPIMGVGYQRPVTQWSKGEYANPSNTEDDLAIINSNGLATVRDDHGDTNGAATPLAGSPPQLSASGLISTQADVDVFSFTAPGGQLVTLAAQPAAVSPNLDIKLDLFDGSGSPVASADVASAYSTADVATGLDATIQQVLAAGTYYMRVDGVGQGTASTGYTEYASLGRYTVNATIGVCGAGDDAFEQDDSTATTRLVLPGQGATGTRCAGDDDWIRFPGINGSTVTANLQATDADLDLDVLDGAGVQQATVSVPAGTTQALVYPVPSNGDRFLRVRSASNNESRYQLTTSMTACPPDDQYEAGLGDDSPSRGTVLSFPGSKDATSCSGDPNNGDFAKVTGTAGREITATLSYPQGSGGIWLYIMQSSVSQRHHAFNGRDDDAHHRPDPAPLHAARHRHLRAVGLLAVRRGALPSLGLSGPRAGADDHRHLARLWFRRRHDHADRHRVRHGDLGEVRQRRYRRLVAVHHRVAHLDHHDGPRGRGDRPDHRDERSRLGVEQHLHRDRSVDRRVDQRHAARRSRRADRRQLRLREAR